MRLGGKYVKEKGGDAKRVEWTKPAVADDKPAKKTGSKAALKVVQNDNKPAEKSSNKEDSKS